MRNKKGWITILTVIMAAIIIGVIIYSYVDPYKVTEVMGKQQSAMLESYTLGEQARDFVSHSAKISARQAVYQLGQKGGWFKGSPCGTTPDGYNLWSAGGKDCYPTDADIEASFKEEFAFGFEEYLSFFTICLNEEEDEEYSLSDIVEYDYKIDTMSTTIEGFPVKDSITFSEVNEEDLPETSTFEYESVIEINSDAYGFIYSVDPYFKAELDIALHDFFEKARTSQAVREDNFGYKYYEFDTGKKLLVISGGAIEEKPLIIRFAIKKP